MILEIIIDEQKYPIGIPDQIIEDAHDFFAQLDKDMDRGWQMSRSWVDKPNTEQRCQIVADKILIAFENENKKSVVLFSAYILSKLSNVKTAYISTDGEMQETFFE